MSFVLQFCAPLTSVRLDNDSVGDHARVVIADVVNRAMNIA